jgi:acetylornithine/N-succinyldiaminopimelate aminotransferase
VKTATTALPSDSMMNTYRRWPVEFVAGSGCHLIAPDGRRFLDLMAGIAVASVGHAHPAIAHAVSDQASRLMHCSNLYRTRPQRDLAERLSELTGGHVAFFCNSGAEAIETALKLARKWATSAKGDAVRVVAAQGSFHGRTYGSLSATGQPAKWAGFGPMLPEFTHVQFGSPDAIASAMGEDVAAVILEPIQGEAGVIVPPDGYLKAARDLCARWDALLILDEIQTGLGRTGRWFAYERDALVPDVVCIAKGLAAGLPIGACLARPEVAATFQPGDHGSTFGGGPVQCAAALATLDVIDTNGLVAHAAAAGERLLDGLRAIVGERAVVRGRGLLIGVQLERPAARQVAEAALDAGLLVNDATPDVVRLCPPLVITDDEIDEALEILDGVFATVLESPQ